MKKDIILVVLVTLLLLAIRLDDDAMIKSCAEKKEATITRFFASEVKIKCEVVK